MACAQIAGWPLVRRIRADESAHDTLWKSLRETAHGTVKSTVPRVIAKAIGLRPEIRDWCTFELERQLDQRNLPEIGYDLVAGEARGVALSIADALET